MILVLGGTTEGRELTERLHKDGCEVVLSNATAFSAYDFDDGITTRSGPLDGDKMKALIDLEGVRALVDATHPFARVASETAKDVCAGASLPYLRFERAPAAIPDDRRVIRVDSVETAGEAACSNGKRVFLATGVKTLGRFVGDHDGAVWFARVLPWPDSLKEALKWLPAERLIAAVGPFSHAFNVACFRHFDADTLITKDSGAGSGVEEKLSAALELDMTTVVMERPVAARDAFSDYERLLDYLRELKLR